MYASRESSSPDPIVLPSSPPSAHLQSRRKSVKHKRSRMSASPTKSLPAKSPAVHGRVLRHTEPTIENKPQDEAVSPAKGRRRRAADSQITATELDHVGESPIKGAMQRVEKRRKGTPACRQTRAQSIAVSEAEGTEEPAYDAGSLQSDQDAGEAQFPPQYTHRHFKSHTQRLSHAREELDTAIRKAVGSGNSLHHSASPGTFTVDPSGDVAGDVTMANEDFTLISGESLASIKANNSILAPVHELDASYLSIDAEHVSPAKGVEIAYPDLEQQAAAVAAIANAAITHVFDEDDDDDDDDDIEMKDDQGYDVMSWRPSGPSLHIALEKEQDNLGQGDLDASLSADVSTAIEPESDIWAEEASRSIEGDVQPDASEKQTADFVPPIFSDEPLPPKRSKIPRTWRRTSGADFSYADSPASVKVPAAVNESAAAYAHTSAGSRHSSRVLTPPSTDDEIANQSRIEPSSGQDATNLSDQRQDDFDLTHPDAAATQLEHQHQNDHISNSELASPLSDSSSNVTSPEGEDTGMFWQSNLPNMYSRQAQRPRFQRRDKSLDLSQILKMDTSKIDEDDGIATTNHRSKGSEPTPTESSSKHNVRPNPTRTRPTQSTSRERERDVTSEKALGSPLARSLLWSSKIGDLSTNGRKLTMHGATTNTTQAEDSTPDDTFASKASDQRQLLREAIPAYQSQHTPRSRPERDNAAWPSNIGYGKADEEVVEEDEEEDDDEEEADLDGPSNSYEELLNLDSPQKIKVNFNDSLLASRDSELLRPTRHYAPLFDRDPNVQLSRDTHSQDKGKVTQSPPSVTLVNKRRATPLLTEEVQTGVFSRLSTSFWAAVIRPTGPIYIDPKPASSGAPELSAEATFPSGLRARIRSRYGVVSEQHPWTMTHMRILHRMLNSAHSGRSDSIIPKTLPLPPSLAQLVETPQISATKMRYVFRHEHACVVHAFMQVLVPVSLVNAMERREVEWLGDHIARQYRGLMGGRRGGETCFQSVKTPDGLIDWQWIVACLGCVVYANEETAKREGWAEDMRDRTVEFA